MKMATTQWRLLPVVIALCGCVLAAKGIDLVEDARASTSAPGPAVAAAKTDSAKPDEAKTGSAGSGDSTQTPAPDAEMEDGNGSASEIDVLTSLAKRRKDLDARARELDMRANLLSAAEKRMDGKIADLKALQAQIQTLLGQRDEAESKQIASLVKVYSAMKPRDAGRIFNSLDQTVLLEVAGQMKPDALAAIMSAMSPDRAQTLTVKLADRLKLPTTAALATSPGQAAPPPPPSAAPAATAAGQ